MFSLNFFPQIKGYGTLTKNQMVPADIHKRYFVLVF